MRACHAAGVAPSGQGRKNDCPGRDLNTLEPQPMGEAADAAEQIYRRDVPAEIGAGSECHVPTTAVAAPPPETAAQDAAPTAGHRALKADLARAGIRRATHVRMRQR